MQYILSEEEFNNLKNKILQDESNKFRGIAQEKEKKILEIGLILHEILETENPPKYINGMDCFYLAQLVQKMVKNQRKLLREKQKN